jgi:hypothetical protein
MLTSIMRYHSSVRHSDNAAIGMMPALLTRTSTRLQSFDALDEVNDIEPLHDVNRMRFASPFSISATAASSFSRRRAPVTTIRRKRYGRPPDELIQPSIESLVDAELVAPLPVVGFDVR